MNREQLREVENRIIFGLKMLEHFHEEVPEYVTFKGYGTHIELGDGYEMVTEQNWSRRTARVYLIKDNRWLMSMPYTPYSLDSGKEGSEIIGSMMYLISDSGVEFKNTPETNEKGSN